MFGIFPVIRFSRSVAVLSVVALVALAGCQILSPRYAPQTPVNPAPQIHFPPIGEPDPYIQFRPIMPGEFVPPMPTWTPPVQEVHTVQEIHIDPPRVESPIVLQEAPDERDQRISELEAELERIMQSSSLISAEESMPAPKIGDNFTRSLPIINRRGVHVYADDAHNVRIQIMDEHLFVPNVWQLSTEGEETLRAVATEIRASHPTAMIDIEGHTDSLMGDPNNPMQKHEIATVKTRLVMDFFVNALRWDAARMSTSSFGRSRPIADNGTPEGRARNNRIEVVVRE